MVEVGIVGAGVVGAEIAGVADVVAVSVRLRRIGDGRAVVEGISPLVAVSIFGVVAGISDAVRVGVGLVSVRNSWTVVERGSNPITIRVFKGPIQDDGCSAGPPKWDVEWSSV